MRFWQIFSFPDRPRFLLWKFQSRGASFTGSLRTGGKIQIRPSPATDYGVAYEVLHQRIYDPPFPIPADSIARVVDVGANVGYSCLFWMREYPRCRVLAFEPHPVHASIVREHLTLNGFDGRVEVMEVAASIAEGTGQLTDARSSSKLVTSSTDRRAFPVRMVDLFDAIGPEPVDILKIDIEGAEYPILADPRFEQISARFIVLEWHRTDEYPDGGAWCTQRLSRMGFEVTETATQANSGLLWARRA